MAATTAFEAVSPAAWSPSYFGFWISDSGLIGQQPHTVIDPKSPI
jgi:hypothetical protein